MAYPLSAIVRSIVATLPLTLSMCAVAQAPTFATISDFAVTPTDASSPNSPLVFDRAGNLYGVTPTGGGFGHGSIFELIKSPKGFWDRRDLHSFTGGADGADPEGPLVFDAAGNLYGTASSGGSGTQANGVVFELIPSPSGVWTEKPIYTFTGQQDPGSPIGALVFDEAGNLYGTTYGLDPFGGPIPYPGSVFELSPQEGGSWKQNTIYTFLGITPAPGGLTIGPNGILYGATSTYTPEGGNGGGGVIYKLASLGSGQWSYTPLHSFPGYDSDGHPLSSDIAYVESALVLDAAGNLYGTAELGGPYGYGAVFEIPAGQGANGPDKILYSFNNVAADGEGYYPVGGLVFDSTGNLYGTTEFGGAYGTTPSEDISGYGKIFEMLPNGSGGWTITTLHDFGGQKYDGFTGIDGKYPAATMVLGADGNLYGDTQFGGYQPNNPQGNGGTAFELVLK